MTIADFWLLLVVLAFIGWSIFLYRHGFLAGTVAEMRKAAVPVGTKIEAGVVSLEDKIKLEVAKATNKWFGGSGAQVPPKPVLETIAGPTTAS